MSGTTVQLSLQGLQWFYFSHVKKVLVLYKKLEELNLSVTCILYTILLVNNSTISKETFWLFGALMVSKPP